MDEPPDIQRARRYQALKDRYPPKPEARQRADRDDILDLRQAVGELSEVVRELVAYLNATSRQADAGNTSEEPANRERLRGLQEAAQALRERFPEEGETRRQ